MERQVRTVLDNFGLIVIGYAGNDETIMKLLEQVSENNGFYWCYVKGYPPDSNVLELVKSKNGRLIEITGFDDLMKEIAGATDFSIDDLVESFERRKENLVERITKFNDQYTKKSLGEYAEEITEKQKEHPSDTRSAVDYFILGYNAQEKGDSHKAEENYRKAIELNPNYAEAYNNLGVLLDKAGKTEETEASYRKAIELNPSSTNAYINLGALLAKDEKRRDEAEEKYNRAIELNPNHAGPYFNLACLYSMKDMKDKSLTYLKQSIEMNSENKLVAKTDSDFDNIRDDEEFKQIVGEED